MMFPHSILVQNAMKRFVDRFASLIVATLCCFDRVVFKGYLPFRTGKMLE